MAHPRLPLPFVALLASAAAASCAHDAPLDDRAFGLLAPAEAITLGDRAAPLFVRGYGGAVPSPDLQRYVTDLGRALTRAARRDDLPWRFDVVNSPEVVAFALPGGQVIVTRGLLALLHDEAQLAAVLAHEIAHVSAGHVDRQLGRAVALADTRLEPEAPPTTAPQPAAPPQPDAPPTAARQPAGASEPTTPASSKPDRLLAALGASGGDARYALSLSPAQEQQADALAVSYLDDAGESTTGAREVLDLLAKLAARNGPGLRWVAVHPFPHIRLDAVERLLRSHHGAASRDVRAEAFRAAVAPALERT